MVICYSGPNGLRQMDTCFRGGELRCSYSVQPCVCIFEACVHGCVCDVSAYQQPVLWLDQALWFLLRLQDTPPQ